MSGLTITWNGAPSSALDGFVTEKVDRNLFGAVRDAAVAIPGRGGDYVFPEARGNRTIAARCQVNGPIDERRSRVEQVADWLDVAGYAELRFSDQTDRFWRARLTRAPDVDEWRRQGKFTVEWSAEPYAYAVALSSQSVTASTPGGSSGSFSVPDGIGAYPVIELTPVGGTMTGFGLTVNGATLSVTGPTVLAGQTITASSIDFTITSGANGDTMLTGAFVASGAWAVDAAGAFAELVSGLNPWSFTWTGTATSVRVRFAWRERLR